MNTFRDFLDIRAWGMFCLGIGSGLPFFLVMSTMGFWMAESGFSKTAIGALTIVSFAYTLKPLWAPFMDQAQVPILSRRIGHRRSWVLINQLFLIVCVALLSQVNPSTNLPFMITVAGLTCLAAALQDSAMGGFRIDMIESSALSTVIAVESAGFRMGMLLAGAGALYLAHTYGWSNAFLVMALIMLPCPIVTLLFPAPKNMVETRDLLPHPPHRKKGWAHAVELFIQPLRSFPEWRVLALLGMMILTMRFSDTTLNAMMAPFLYDMGLTKIDFANATKLFGIPVMIVGGLAAKFLYDAIGMINSLTVCCTLQFISCWLYIGLYFIGAHTPFLYATMAIENLTAGLYATLFILFIAGLCHRPFTATHFATFAAFASLCRIGISVFMGYVADIVNWPWAFALSSMISLIAIALLYRFGHIIVPQGIPGTSAQ